MPGPLPNPQRRRRNEPTIPTTSLPVSGRKGVAPAVPSWCKLQKVGKAWWRWAWATPQACAWGTGAGMESMIARRASLEDDLSATEAVDGLDFATLLDADNAREFKDVVGRVAAMATGRLQIMREMRELDDRLGLTPKGLAALRWQVVADSATEKPQGGSNVTHMADRRKSLSDAS